MSDFADRLAELIGGKRKNSEFARKTGLKETNIRQYLAGTTPGLDKVVQIARATGVHINWLATGEGPRDSSTDMLQMQQRGTQQEQRSLPMLPVLNAEGLVSNGLVLVPQLDVQAAAGAGRTPTDESVLGLLAFQETYLRYLGINPRSAQVIQVSGHSMTPTLQHEDLVIVDTSIDHVRDEALYAVVYGGLVLIKRVHVAPDGAITLSSDNKLEGSDTTIRKADLGDLIVAGRVCGRVSRM